MTRVHAHLRLCTLIAALALGAGFALGPVGPAHAVPTLTWVSGTGDDANPCTWSAPCRTFAGAISKTAEGGVIAALDGGGFGSVTIAKAITIDATGSMGGIQHTGLANGIIVNAGADDDVVLRGISFAGSYTTGACAPTGGAAVRVLNAHSVRVEASTLSNNADAAVQVVPTASSPSVVIAGTDIRNTCNYGVRVAPGAGRTAAVLIHDSTISNAGTALQVEAGGSAVVRSSAVFANRVATAGGGTIDISDPSNQVVGNTATGNPSQSSPSIGDAARTWVAAGGDDTNPCSRTSPCLTLAGAFAKTLTGGVINAINAGSYGPLTINRAVTVDFSGVMGGIAGAGVNGISINVGAQEDVILRGLDIVGGPAAATCTSNMPFGVLVLQARSVHIEDSRISNVMTAGVSVANPSGVTRVKVNRTQIRNGCGSGVSAQPGAGASADVLVRDSSLSRHTTAVLAGTGASVWVAGSELSYNGTALAPTGGAITTFYGTNALTGNASDGTPTSMVNAPVPVPTPTVTEQVQVPVPVQVEVPVAGPPIAQKPLGCDARLPKKVKKSRSYVLLARTCWTNAENTISVTVAGKGKAVRGKGGKVKLRTGSGHGTVTVSFSAPATATHAAYVATTSFKF